MRVAFVTTTLLVLTFLSWVWLAPTTVRGSVTYTTVAGSSMEPYLHRGDLALLRKEKQLQVGDVAAYRSTTGRHVLHRVIAQQGAGYVFQGDNNSWRDTDRPTDNEVVGRLWLRVPRLGEPMRWMQAPAHAALMAGALAAMTAGGMVPPSRRKWPRRFFHRPGDNRVTMLLLAAAGPPGRVFIGVMLAIATVALTLVTGAFLVSPFRADPAELGLRHHGTFSYFAPSVTPSLEDLVKFHEEHGDTRADVEQMDARLRDPLFRTFLEVPSTTGQPLVTLVNPRFDLSFQYVLESGVAESIHGSTTVSVLLRDVTGWSRTLPLTPRTDFNGNRILVKASNVDLRGFMTSVDLYEAVTGHAPRYYTASFVVDVEIHGTVSGEPFTDVFQPRMVMRVLSPVEAYPETEETRAFELPGGGTTATIYDDPFHTHKAGAVDYEAASPRRVTMLGVSLDVHTLRWLSLTMLGAGLLPIGRTVYLMSLAGRRGEAFIIRADMARAWLRWTRRTTATRRPRRSSCPKWTTSSGCLTTRAGPCWWSRATDAGATWCGRVSTSTPTKASKRGQVRRPRNTSRSLRLVVFVAMGLLALVSVLSVDTASNSVPPTRLGQDVRAIGPNDLKPAACAALNLTRKVVGGPAR